MFGNIGWVELVVIGVVLLLLFGGKKLPELAKGVTKASKEFKAGLNGDGDDDSKSAS